MERITELAKQYGILVVFALVGGGILIYGLWGVVAPEKATVEIVKGTEHTNKLTDQQTNEIVVDVAGSVEKPGVYKLPSGSRIGDALVIAGGLSAMADREWVAKTMNLAEEVEDGEKVYIPNLTEKTKTSENQSIKVVDHGKVNINTASLAELDSLDGVGEVRAKLILDNRPYSKTEDLVTKAKIPSSVYEKIKNNITVY